MTNVTDVKSEICCCLTGELTKTDKKKLDLNKDWAQRVLDKETGHSTSGKTSASLIHCYGHCTFNERILDCGSLA